MRNRLATLASVLLAVAACTSAAAPPDPYDLLAASGKAAWNPVQINIGATFTVAGKAIKLDPADMAIVIDSAGQKAAIHISVPAETLGVPVSALDQLGIPGDSIDFDVVYSGDALFVRSPVMAPMLKMLLGPVGRLPSGDLTGWLKVGTKEELAALSAMAGAAGPTPSFAAGSLGGDSRKILEEAGIGLTTAPAVEKRNGVDAQHIAIKVDTARLATNQYFLLGAGAQKEQSAAMIKAITFSGDVWIDNATKRAVEVDMHIASASDPAQGGDVTVTAHDPDGSVSLAAPSSSVDVPISVLISEMMKLVNGGAVS